MSNIRMTKEQLAEGEQFLVRSAIDVGNVDYETYATSVTRRMQIKWIKRRVATRSKTTAPRHEQHTGYWVRPLEAVQPGARPAAA